MTSNNYQFPNLANPTKQGLYDPRFEHEACGVGLVADIKGRKSHSIITQGIEILMNLGHRGASGADAATGDGAGILLQIPHEFFVQKCRKLDINLPEPGNYGIGTLFLSQDASHVATCQQIVERIVSEHGQTFLGWRNVPIKPGAIGTLANKVRPTILQFFVGCSNNLPTDYPFELKLYVIRRLIEKKFARSSTAENKDLYVCSLSSKQIVYKGLIMANQLMDFYPDINHELMMTSFALVHSRFSTNTLGSWKLAHPYRYIIHNGEINTLQGNINGMTARQDTFSSSVLGDDVKNLLPIISAEQSDTASLDNALELLLATGRSLPHAMMMLIPEAWADHIPMEQAKKDFYEYHSCLMEPWDGPALVIASDGTKVCAILDRNGLRPCRYLVTSEGLLVMASETGVLNIPPEKVLFKSRIEPGRMFLLDTEEGRLVDDSEIKKGLAGQQPYGRWLKDNKITLHDLPEPGQIYGTDFKTLQERQKTFGYTLETLHMIMEPMASNGSEPVGSMGNDVPLAVLSNHTPLLFNYFKQLFAQVSNPPLDAIREELVTSVETFIGPEGNLFKETPEQCHQLNLKAPILTNKELEKIRAVSEGKLKTKTLSALFSVNTGVGTLQKAMDALRMEASKAIEEGYSILILSDRGVDNDHIPIPSLLATSGLHHHLIREGNRTKVDLVVESGEPCEVAHFAALLGYGAGAINPYMALETLAKLVDDQDLYTTNYLTVEKNYIKSIHKGIIKIMSKMGISTLQSYRGAQIFEAIGLKQDFIDKYFKGTPSRIGGVGLDEIELESRLRHETAYLKPSLTVTSDLKSQGWYQWREGGEYHMWNPDTIATLQHAVRSNDSQTYEEFSNFANNYGNKLSTIRGLLRFKKVLKPVPLREVEPAKEIVKRFATGAASLGSISREAHESLAIAMNRINARSNTGEGGEDFRRYTKDENGDSRNSAMKQVASGRFGVTINYLSNATDLQIKMAQGSKPGEGGQLPGDKVDEYIGWVRSSTPGVELISPPPHHDIYSIEDLAQLIHDLKNSNPTSRIHVKLVAEAGVGTIAAGVSKGHADVVLISGDSGGTGASPESSIKHAGLPWEIGLAETQQVLVMNDLRGRIVVQTDGQLKTGRDVAVACLLGAEEFGFATAPLITMGCIMLRKCHLNTCSVGIATQDPELRKKFVGKPEQVINYFFFVAEELRSIMSELGFRTVNEMVGRMDILETSTAVNHWKAQGIDLSNLLHMPLVPDGVATHHCQGQDHALSNALDHQLIEKSSEALNHGIPTKIHMQIRNSNRTVGTMLSHEIAKRYGEDGLPENTIQINFEGSAGQSFAAFLAKGISMHVEGDANDYFCKGLSGGRAVIIPPKNSNFIAEDNIIVGNVCLYGGTGGQVYIRGIAGERFAVRNSGADAVVEGVGDHGCEYMTRGIVVVLGPTGRNFAAGMSGGEAYVLDEHNKFNSLCNEGMVDLDPVETDEDKTTLRNLIQQHFECTGSSNAERILKHWDKILPRFVKVMPRDYKRILANKTNPYQKSPDQKNGVGHG